MFNESLSQVAVIGNRECFYHAACTLCASFLTYLNYTSMLSSNTFSLSVALDLGHMAPFSEAKMLT